MQRIKAALGHPVARSIGGVGAAAATGQLLTLAASPVLARIYDQEAFGAFGLFFGVANIVATVVMLGLNDAIIAADDDNTALALARACGLTAVLLTVPAVLLVVILRATGLFGWGGMPLNALWLLLIEVPVLCALSITQASLVRARIFAGVAHGHLALGVSRACAQIGAGFLLGGFVGLATGEIVSRFCAVIAMGFALVPFLHSDATPMRVSIGMVMRQFRNFILFRTPSTVLGAIAVVAPTFVMASAFDLRQAGYFSLMYATVMAPIGFVQKAVGDVFLGHYATRMKTDRRAATRFFWGTVAALAVPAAILVVIFVLLAPDLFRVAFGPKWMPSGAMAVATTPLLFVSLIVVPVSQVVNAANRPHFKLYFDFANLGTLAFAYVVGRKLGLAPVEFVALMAWSVTLAYMLFMALIVRIAGLPQAGHISRDSTPKDDLFST